MENCQPGTARSRVSARSRYRRIDPLTLILINAVLPIVNMLFPSDKGIILSALLAFVAMVIVGRYRTLLKSVFWVAVGAGIIYMNHHFLHSMVLSMLLKMTLLFIPCLLIGILIVTGYHSSEIISALQRLHLPKLLIIGLTVTIRYIPTFRREFATIKQAMIIRGVSFTMKHPMRTFEYLIVPQLFRCVSLSSELTAAALTKGLGVPDRRTSYFASAFSPADYAMGVLCLIGSILIIGGRS